MQARIKYPYPGGRKEIVLLQKLLESSAMELGKLHSVNHVNWDLPADSEISMKFLHTLEKQKTTFYLGAPMWSPKEWVNLIYPKGTPAKEYLYHYSRSYNTIELNTTHYRIPTENQAQQWVSQVPANFRFCPKVLQAISHEDLLNKNLLTDWWNFLEKIQSNLGPCFIQFHNSFSYSEKSALHRFLEMWPQEFDLALEFRHPSWFQNGEILPALVQYLQKKHFGLVITDVAGRRDVLHTSVSAPYSMLRFIGNNLHASDFKRANDWAQKIQHWSQSGLQKMFIFVHEPENPPVIEMSEYMIEKLNDVAHAGLTPLKKQIPSQDPQMRIDY